MKTKILILLFTFLLLPFLAEAQCAMCRAVLESEGSETRAEGINQGILYLMAFPYLLIGGIAYYIYYKFKKKKTSE